jgi:hypothetical protein
MTQAMIGITERGCYHFGKSGRMGQDKFTRLVDQIG